MFFRGHRFLSLSLFLFFTSQPAFPDYGPPKPENYPAFLKGGDGPSGGSGNPGPADIQKGFIPSFPVKVGDGPSGGTGDPVPRNVYSSLTVDNADLWRQSIIHSVEFFNYYAWDETSGSYASDIDIYGKKTSDNRYIVASGRMLYGLSHGASVIPQYQHLAARQAKFIIDNMIRRDSMGPYFLTVVDSQGEIPKGLSGLEPLVVNEQAYGISGLVAYYRLTKEPDLLHLLRELVGAFELRFRDRIKGGFYEKYDLLYHKAMPEKGFDSVVYVATSFLFEFAEADTHNRKQSQRTLLELADIVTDHFVDRKTGWIIENFDRDWNADWRGPDRGGWQKQGAYTVSPVGHNFQAAWFLLRASQLEAADPKRKVKYRESAKFIITSMLSKPAIDRIHGGVYDSFKRETDELMWGSNKAWWQQAEAMLALTQAEKMGVITDPDALKVRDDILKFYFNFFVVPDHYVPGGEYKMVTETGKFTSDAKGEAGKSVYHTVELARCMTLLNELYKLDKR